MKKSLITFQAFLVANLQLSFSWPNALIWCYPRAEYPHFITAE
jgi:hypothetical protein